MRLKLSALWASVMFLYVYVDIIHFYKPGIIEGILAGQVWKFDISQGWALGGFGPHGDPQSHGGSVVDTASPRARWTNLVVAALFVPISIGNVLGETWAFYWFGSAVEAALLLMVIRYSWTWPRRVD